VLGCAGEHPLTGILPWYLILCVCDLRHSTCFLHFYITSKGDNGLLFQDERQYKNEDKDVMEKPKLTLDKIMRLPSIRSFYKRATPNNATATSITGLQPLVTNSQHPHQPRLHCIFSLQWLENSEPYEEDVQKRVRTTLSLS
jgi:hypothetical protein